jgi:hypothetical protein
MAICCGSLHVVQNTRRHLQSGSCISIWFALRTSHTHRSHSFVRGPISSLIRFTYHTRTMFPLSFTASTFLGVLLALKSIENVISCPSHHGAKELDGPPVAGCADESRRLQDVAYVCLGPPTTPGQVQAVAAAVDQFYKGQPPGTRRLQDTIAIDVNFIVVRTTDNRGSTQGHAKAQIDFLNLTFLPDFKFNLKNNKVVVNDDYFYQG